MCKLLDAAYVSARAREVYGLADRNVKVKQHLGLLVDKDALRVPHATTLARTIIEHGEPLQPIAETSDKDVTKRMKEYNENSLQRVLAHCGQTSVAGACQVQELKIEIISFGIYGSELTKIIIHDSIYVGVALVFVSMLLILGQVEPPVEVQEPSRLPPVAADGAQVGTSE